MSEWRTHVKKVYDEMKKKDSTVLLKDALKAASKSWKKGAKAVGDRADDAKLGKKGGDCSSMSEVKKGGDDMDEEVVLSVPAATAGGVDEDDDTDGAGGGGKKNKTGKKSKKSQKSKKGGKTKKNRKSKKTDIDLTDPKYMD
jgi:hypothetical protein